MTNSRNSNSDDKLILSDSKKVDRFIAGQEKWQSQLGQLREIIFPSKAANPLVIETMKWSLPTYTVSGKIVISIGSFKNHYALWFHQGVFLKDRHSVLVNVQEGLTKAMRQWRFDENSKVESELVKLYVEEAIANQLAGKELKPERKVKHQYQDEKLGLPVELVAAFKLDECLKNAFQALSPGKQKEYALHVGSAKQDKTRRNRIEKIGPMILSGVGLNDKYRN